MRNIFAASAFIFTYGFLDSLSTFYGLKHSSEANGIAVLAFRAYGFPGIFALKVVGILAVFSAFAVLSFIGFKRTAFTLLALSAVAGTLVCVNNILFSLSYALFSYAVVLSFMSLPFVAALEFEKLRNESYK